MSYSIGIVVNVGTGTVPFADILLAGDMSSTRFFGANTSSLNCDENVYLNNVYWRYRRPYAETILPLRIPLPEGYKNRMASLNGTFIDDFLKLNNFVEKVSHPALTPFVEKLQHDEGLLEAFITIPASMDNHHSCSHGLLAHSVEVALLTLDRLSALSKSNEEVQVGIIGALFHDIGKCFHAASTNELRYVPCRHEDKTMVILTDAISALYKREPSWLEVLEACWATSASVRNVNCPIVSIVRNADKDSACDDYCVREFEGAPSRFWFKIVRNYGRVVRVLPSRRP
ncbi:hypothetical protein [Vibrio maritimus]|uniref:hypothetical protein n=1 Tax=Vibrio maritimus TaxID=990268 RepID=UPI0037361EF3